MDNILNMPAPSEHLKAALKYAEMGWHVFPCWEIKDGHCACGKTCTSPGKHPISHIAPRGQNSATTDAETIKKWWKEFPTANIAVYLGASGLCAVDIDPRNGGDFTIDDLEHQHGKIEAEVVALTGGSGEHRIFQAPVGNLPGKLGKGVDLKLNGYIIVEPSNHISGGKYEWEASSNPFDGCIAGPLPDWIRSFGQHDVPSVNTTGVSNPILDNQQVLDLEDALHFVDSDERDNWIKVGMALHATGDGRAYGWWCLWSQTSQKYDEKDQYRVWRSFRLKGLDGYSIATVFDMAKKGGWLNRNAPLLGGGGALEIVVTDNEQLDDIVLDHDEHGNDLDVPDHLLDFPVPMLNAIAYWMEGFSEEPQRQITIQGTLALASTLTGRLYRSSNNNPTTCYFMTLAGTGVGKNYVKSAIRRFFAECGYGKLLSGAGNTSAGAVFSALFESPNHLQITDEFGKSLQAARKQANGAMSDAFAVMTEAYSDATGLLVPRNYSSFHMDKKARAQIDKKNVFAPSITMLAFATPEQVFGNLSSVEIDDGFLNRFVAVEAKLPTAEEKDIVILPLPEEITSWAKSIRNIEPEGNSLAGIDTDYDQEPVPIIVPFSPQAKQLFDDFKKEIKANEKTGKYVEPKLTKRWRENAMRMATSLAVCDNPQSPIISERLAAWAIDYARYSGQKFMDSVSVNVADSDFHRLYLNVKTLVERAKEKGMTERDLSTYSRLFSSSPPNLRDQALGALVRDGVVHVVKYKPASGRGKERAAYVAAEYIRDGIANDI